MACSALINKWTIECDLPDSQAYVSSDKYNGMILFQDKIILKVYDTSSFSNENDIEIYALGENCFIKVNYEKKTIIVIDRNHK